MSSDEKAAYRQNNILKEMLIFDLSQCLTAAAYRQKPYDIGKWSDIVLVPEGANLALLAHATMCLDLVTHSSPSVRKINEYWHTEKLNLAQLKYTECDAQSTVISYLVFWRYGLLPEASDLIPAFPHDHISTEEIWKKIRRNSRLPRRERRSNGKKLFLWRSHWAPLLQNGYERSISNHDSVLLRKLLYQEPVGVLQSKRLGT